MLKLLTSLALVGVISALAALPCDAQERPWELVLELGTDVPISVGARAVVKAPFGARLSLSGGLFPGPYLDLINAAVVPFTSDEGYDENDAKVVRDALENSAVVRLHGGWHITRNLYAEVGYGFVGLGGGVSGQDIIVLVTDFDGDLSGGGRRGRQLDYTVESALHMLDFELGWEWLDLDPWVFRTALGLAWTLGSSTSVRANFTPVLAEANADLEAFAEAYLDDLYTTYVISPTFSFAAGYSF